jgi:hypothetical protein
MVPSILAWTVTVNLRRLLPLSLQAALKARAEDTIHQREGSTLIVALQESHNGKHHELLTSIKLLSLISGRNI